MKKTVIPIDLGLRLLLGTNLCLHLVTALTTPFWNDELISADYASNLPLKTLVLVPAETNHPNLYLIIFKLLLTVSSNLSILRLFEVGLFLLTTIGLSQILRLLSLSQRSRWLILIMWTSSAYFLSLNFQIRAYGLGLFFTVISLWLTLKHLKDKKNITFLLSIFVDIVGLLCFTGFLLYLVVKWLTMTTLFIRNNDRRNWKSVYVFGIVATSAALLLFLNYQYQSLLINPVDYFVKLRGDYLYWLDKPVWDSLATSGDFFANTGLSFLGRTSGIYGWFLIALLGYSSIKNVFQAKSANQASRGQDAFIYVAYLLTFVTVASLFVIARIRPELNYFHYRQLLLFPVLSFLVACLIYRQFQFRLSVNASFIVALIATINLAVGIYDRHFDFRNLVLLKEVEETSMSLTEHTFLFSRNYELYYQYCQQVSLQRCINNNLELMPIQDYLPSLEASTYLITADLLSYWSSQGVISESDCESLRQGYLYICRT